ncbi:hypothetical protein AB0L33_30255 [Streptomyces sp. NPDC052299]|uniref:hypothetical protein n=1 Tax=Streptomyces sp. NPDC052299 TaxID=3155054 RepID=UPI00342B61A6
MPRKRPGRVRTKHTNGRAALLLSTMNPADYNVRLGEVRTITCPDCRTWRRIMGDTVLKIREHRIDTVSQGEKPPSCPGSDQLVVIDIDVRRWQARQDRLLRDAMPQENRRAARQFYKPLPNPATPVYRLATREPQPLARLVRLLEQARHAGLAHRVNCSLCNGSGRCQTGRDLEITFQETRATCLIAREQQARAERLAVQQARNARAAQESARSTQLLLAGQADQLRRAVPHGERPTEGPQVPLASLAPRQAAVRREGSQLACEHCGATESSLADAVDAGWCRITRRLHCGRCATRFPEWARTSF